MTDSVPAAPASGSKRALLLKLGAAAAVLLVGAILVLRGYDVKGLIQQGLDLVRGAGPVVFFLAAAILPAFGAPQTAFSLSAGPLFGQQLGTGWVVLFASLAMLANMAFTYWLARWLLRPLLEKLFVRLGYKLPQVNAGTETDLIILLRVTPGIPFTAQNHLLGLARARFWRYLFISFLIQGPMNAAFVAFGDAIMKGKGRYALLGFSVIVVLVVGTHFLRKHYGRKAAPVAPVAPPAS